MDSFDRIRQLRDTYESALDEAEVARAEYHRAILKAHRSGVSLREIAEQLGISHQRVHQIVTPPGRSRRTRRAGRAVAGVVGAALVVGSVGLFLSSRNTLTSNGSRGQPPPPSRSAPAITPIVAIAGCRTFPFSSSASTLVTTSAACQQEVGSLLRQRAAVALLDPRTGEVLAVTGGSFPSLRDLIERLST
jgi:hypothetical protein